MNANQLHRRILMVTDIDDEQSVPTITFELLGAARDIAKDIEGIVCAAVMGNELKAAAQCISDYADEVYCIEDSSLMDNPIDFASETLVQLCKQIQPAVILMGQTPGSLDLAMKFSCQLGVQMVTDCTGFQVGPNATHLMCRKPIYGDNAIATIKTEMKPAMATLRPMALAPATKMPSTGTLIAFTPELHTVTASYAILENVKGEDSGLDKAKAIVAGGRGINDIADISQLEALIAALKNHFESVEMGASRPLVDNGWLPHLRQIGLTGQKVSPELYIAIGISGALQHMSGVFGAKTIVAINSDPDAPIFNYADLGVAADYHSILPALIDGIKEIK